MTATRSAVAGSTAAAAGYLHATMPLAPSLARAAAGIVLVAVAIYAVATTSPGGGRHSRPFSTRGGHPALALGGYVLAALVGVASLAGPQMLLLTVGILAVTIIAGTVIAYRFPAPSSV